MLYRVTHHFFVFNQRYVVTELDRIGCLGTSVVESRFQPIEISWDIAPELYVQYIFPYVELYRHGYLVGLRFFFERPPPY